MFFSIALLIHGRWLHGGKAQGSRRVREEKANQIIKGKKKYLKGKDAMIACPFAYKGLSSLSCFIIST